MNILVRKVKKPKKNPVFLSGHDVYEQIDIYFISLY